jgi:hypothetical protein
MNCDSVSELIPLYYYGELPPDEEDHVEEHLHNCPDCARALERQTALAMALDRRHTELPALLLEECRADLMAAVAGGAPRSEKAKGPWTLFLEAMGATFSGLNRMRQPIGALALIAVGFFAARFTGGSPSPAPSSPNDQVFSTVRSIRPDNSGRVQIDFDETRRRTVTGSLEEPDVQKLVLAAAREENPAVRVESVDLLKNRGASGAFRDPLINALLHDSNSGVRMKALEGLKPFAGDAEVRKAFTQVLVSDDNPALRMQVVDLLVAQADDSMVGMMQGVVQKEDNDYIRLKLEKALKDMNASIGTF